MSSSSLRGGVPRTQKLWGRPECSFASFRLLPGILPNFCFPVHLTSFFQILFNYKATCTITAKEICVSLWWIVFCSGMIVAADRTLNINDYLTSSLFAETLDSGGIKPPKFGSTRFASLYSLRLMSLKRRQRPVLSFKTGLNFFQKSLLQLLYWSHHNFLPL